MSKLSPNENFNKCADEICKTLNKWLNLDMEKLWVLELIKNIIVNDATKREREDAN